MTGPLDPYRWFRPFGGVETTATAPRLLCFPYAGGSAGYYHRLAVALAPTIEVVAVQYPGRQDRHRETPIDDLERLAELIAAELPSSGLLDGEVAFFGHSMGAIVAFEVRRRLGVEPSCFVASGRKAPVCSDVPDEQLDDEGVLAMVERLGAASGEVLRRPDYLRMMMPTLRADHRAIQAYVHRPAPPLPCPVVALGGTDDPMATTDQIDAWRQHATNDFARYEFPGGHFFLNENLPAVAAIVRQHVAG